MIRLIYLELLFQRLSKKLCFDLIRRSRQAQTKSMM